MRKICLVIAVVVCLLLSPLSFAQAQTGASLYGTVTDKAGAGLGDVAVTIKNVGTGEMRTITTDGGGRYQASGLPPEHYRDGSHEQNE